MASNRGVWMRPATRRRVLQSGAAGVSVAWLAACGGGGKQESKGSTASQATSAPNLSVGNATAVAAPVGQPKRGGTLTMVETAALASLDPFTQANRAAQTLAAHAYSRLLKLKTGPSPDDYYKYDIIGDTAASWEMPSDGSQVTFKLRPNAAFHDKPPVNGRNLTSEDVKMTFERFRTNPANTNKEVFGSAANPLITDVQTPDATTVVLKLAQPFAPLMSLLSEGQYLWLMPKEIDSGFDPKKEQIGAGPYMLDSVQPDVAVSWKRHPKYFLGEQPYIDNIRRVFISDLAQQVSQFQAGTLDYYPTSKEQKDQIVKSNPKTQVITYLRAGSGNTIGMQQKVPGPFRDIRVRRAASLAMDREAWAQVYYGGDTYRPSNVVPPTFLKYLVDPTKPEAGPGSAFFKYDPKQARQLLQAAGQENVNFRFSYTNNGYGTAFNSSAEATAGMLKEAGFNPTQVTQDYLREFIEPTRGSLFGNYEGMLYMIQAPYSEPHFYLITHYHSKGPRNLFGVPDPKLDELVEKQAKTLNEQERIKVIKELQTYALEQQLYVYTGPGPQYLLLQPWVKNFNYAFEGWGSHIAESAIYSWIDKS